MRFCLQKSVFFNKLVKSLSLPIGWSTYIDGNIVILYKPVNKINQLVIEKQIVITDDVSVNFYVYNILIEPASLGLIPLTYPINTKNLADVIGSFNYKQVCQGGPMTINFPSNEFNVFYIFITLLILLERLIFNNDFQILFI